MDFANLDFPTNSTFDFNENTWNYNLTIYSEDKILDCCGR